MEEGLHQGGKELLIHVASSKVELPQLVLPIPEAPLNLLDQLFPEMVLGVYDLLDA